MSEWIDQIANTLTAEQQQRTAENMEKERQRGIIKAHGPEFFSSLLNHLDYVTQEIRAKLSAVLREVKFTPDGESFAFLAHGRMHAQLKGAYHPVTIDVTLTVSGDPNRPPHGERINLTFNVDGDRLYVMSNGVRIDRPEDLAHALLKRAVEAALPPPLA